MENAEEDEPDRTMWRETMDRETNSFEDFTNAEIFALVNIAQEMFPESVLESVLLEPITVTMGNVDQPSIQMDWFTPGEIVEGEAN